MTLPDSDEKIAKEMPKAHIDLGETIQKMIMKSLDDNRLVCGVFDCAQQLEKDADHVMICLLPDVADQQVPVRIQHTLIEAFCRENAVPVLKWRNRLNTLKAIRERVKRKLSSVSNNLNPYETPRHAASRNFGSKRAAAISTGAKFNTMLANKDMKATTQSKSTEAHAHAPLERKSSNTRDYNCFLVKRPDVLSSDEQYIKTFCENQPLESRHIIQVPS